VKYGNHIYTLLANDTSADPADVLADEGITFYAFDPNHGAFAADIATNRIPPQLTS
jgi:hypothetical protein